MTKVKWIITSLVTIIIIVVTLFIISNRKISSQEIEISELHDSIRDLEEKVSTLENDNSELEKKNEQLERQVKEISDVATQSLNAIQFRQNYIPLASSNGFATVIYRIPSCDYFILENNSGFIVAEWMGGSDPDLGDNLSGNFNSFGTKDFYNQSRSRDCRLWIEDYSLSKDDALEKARSECN
jgi:hypothetical protein